MKTLSIIYRAINHSNKYLIFLLLLSIPFNLCFCQNSYKKLLNKAVKETYSKGIYEYGIRHKSLTSNGDTVLDNYLVTIINTRKEFSFNSKQNDSLAQVYYNNLALRSNINTKQYFLKTIEPEDAIFEFDAVFRPFVDKEFQETFESDSMSIIKLFENKGKYVLKIEIFNPGEVDTLFYIVSISKYTNSITEYSVYAAVGGIPIYEKWDLLWKKEYNSATDSLNINKNLFYYTIRTFKPFCKSEGNSSEKIDNSKKLTLTELQGSLPFFHFISTFDDTLELNKLNSKYYLVDFWFRSCLPCIKSVPVLKELHSKYDESYLKIVSINNIDKTKELINKYVLDNNLPYKVYTQSVEYGKRFDSIHSYPTFIIFDSQFNVLKTIEGYSDTLFQEIEDVIQDD